MHVDMESPSSALASAARAKIEVARESFLASGNNTCFQPLTSLVWDKGAGSIERLDLVRREGWA